MKPIVELQSPIIISHSYSYIFTISIIDTRVSNNYLLIYRRVTTYYSDIIIGEIRKMASIVKDILNLHGSEYGVINSPYGAKFFFTVRKGSQITLLK